MYKLSFYVPTTHLDTVKMALFATGAGKIGNYDCCAWQTLGQGQFRPLEGSQAFIGQQGVIETVEEVKVEMVCENEVVESVIAELKKAHPYETPAYQVWKLAEF